MTAVDPFRAAVRAKQTRDRARAFALMHRGEPMPEAQPTADSTPKMPTISAGSGSGDRRLRQPADFDTALRLLLGR